MPPSTPSVYCLKYAETVLSERMVFLGGNAEKHIPIAFAVYLIQTNERNILIDAGCDTMPGFMMKRFYSPAFVLRQAGVSADEITDLVITHAHHDHIDAAWRYPHATVYISKTAYETGKAHIPNSSRVILFEDEYHLTPQIKLVEWGGHARGSSVVEITTDDSVHVLAGDECYINKNITEKICTGAFCNDENAMRFIQTYTTEPYRVHTFHDITLKTERIL